MAPVHPAFVAVVVAVVVVAAGLLLSPVSASDSDSRVRIVSDFSSSSAAADSATESSADPAQVAAQLAAASASAVDVGVAGSGTSSAESAYSGNPSGGGGVHGIHSTDTYVSIVPMAVSQLQAYAAANWDSNLLLALQSAFSASAALYKYDSTNKNYVCCSLSATQIQLIIANPQSTLLAAATIADGTHADTPYQYAAYGAATTTPDTVALQSILYEMSEYGPFFPASTPAATVQPSPSPSASLTPIRDVLPAGGTRFVWGTLGPILDQGPCGACYAFAATRVFQDRMNGFSCAGAGVGSGSSSTANAVHLSPQRVISCAGGPHPCSGGNPIAILSAMSYNPSLAASGSPPSAATASTSAYSSIGFSTRACNPYFLDTDPNACPGVGLPNGNECRMPSCASQTGCSTSGADASDTPLLYMPIDVRVMASQTPPLAEVLATQSFLLPNADNSAATLAARTTTLMTIIAQQGPVVASMLVFEDFHSWWSSPESALYVYNQTTFSAPAGYHAVSIVGWGSLAGMDYWVVANSWGTEHGRAGYFYILRGQNFCFIESVIVYPYATASDFAYEGTYNGNQGSAYQPSQTSVSLMQAQQCSAGGGGGGGGDDDGYGSGSDEGGQGGYGRRRRLHHRTLLEESGPATGSAPFAPSTASFATTGSASFTTTSLLSGSSVYSLDSLPGSWVESDADSSSAISAALNDLLSGYASTSSVSTTTSASVSTASTRNQLYRITRVRSQVVHGVRSLIDYQSVNTDGAVFNHRISVLRRPGTAPEVRRVIDVPRATGATLAIGTPLPFGGVVGVDPESDRTNDDNSLGLWAIPAAVIPAAALVAAVLLVVAAMRRRSHLQRYENVSVVAASSLMTPYTLGAGQRSGGDPSPTPAFAELSSVVTRGRADSLTLRSN